METCAHNARQGGLFAGSAVAVEQQRSPPRGTAEENISSLLCRPGLPKGHGAIRGVGEKVTANPFNGPGSLSVPRAMSVGRPAFGPQLTLSYDSGTGHGPLGPGGSPSLPSITSKTDKGLSKSRDAEKSHVFILSGAEGSVPVLKGQGGKWVPGSFDRTVNNAAYNAVGNFLQMQHCGSDGAHPDRTRAYRTSEPSQVKPGKQSNRLTSTAIRWTTKTYGGGDDYRRHTGESAIKRRNVNDEHSIVYGRDRQPLRSRRAIGPGGLGFNIVQHFIILTTIPSFRPSEASGEICQNKQYAFFP